MKGWTTARLGDVLTRAERFEARDEWTEYPFAGTFSFARGIFVGERKMGSTFKLPNVQRIKAGDFVYCKIMAWEGAFGLVPDKADDCVMSGAFVAYEIDTSRLEPRFLDLYFKIPKNWKELGGQSSGTNVRRQSLHPKQFEAHEIPLPPLAEQRRIVARIEALAAEIAEAKRLRQEAVAEAEALGKAWLNHRLQAAKKQYGSEKMIGVASCAVGFGFPKDYQGRAGLKYPFVKVSDMNLPDNARNITTAQNWIDDQDVDEMRVRIYPVGTVIFPKIGGAIATNKRRMLSLPATFDNNVMGLLPSDRLSSDFLFAFMQNFDLTQLQAGTSVPAISQGKVEEIQIAVPPLPEQRRIVAELDALQAQVDGLKRMQSETAAELDALLPAILDQAFKGEL